MLIKIRFHLKVDSGTDLGWSDHNGNCIHSGAFIHYEDALEDALNLIDQCDLKKFKKETYNDKFHWGKYAEHLNTKFRKK